MLQMAIATQDEVGGVEEHIEDPKAASVDVMSNGLIGVRIFYQLVQVAGNWQLSVAQQMKDQPNNVPFDAQLAMGQKMITGVAAAADAMEKGQLQTIEDVQRKISEALPGP